MGKEAGRREGASDLLSWPLPGSTNMQGPDQTYLLKRLLKQHYFLNVIAPVLSSTIVSWNSWLFRNFPHWRHMLKKTWEASYNGFRTSLDQYRALAFQVVLPIKEWKNNVLPLILINIVLERQWRLRENESRKSRVPVPHNNGNLTKFILPVLRFLINKMEMTAALPKVMAVLLEQQGRAQGKHAMLFGITEASTFLLFRKRSSWEERWVFLSFCFKAPIQCKINTRKRILSPRTQWSLSKYLWFAGQPYSFQSTGSARGEAGVCAGGWGGRL